MTKWLKRKEFTNIFLPFTNKGKQIWVVTRVKKLPSEIVQMAVNLAELDFIKYIRICDKTLSASSENYPNRPKVPVTHMNHEIATGIEIIYHINYKIIDFYEINSPTKGNGSKMVEAILKDFPEDWHPAVLMDWSNGFWNKMRLKHNDLDWLM
jgi:hypothetical protein